MAQAAQAQGPIAPGQGVEQYVALVNQLYSTVQTLTQQVQALQQQSAHGAGSELTNLKSFSKVPFFDGSVGEFKDFEFKLQQFVTSWNEFED